MIEEMRTPRAEAGAADVKLQVARQAAGLGMWELNLRTNEVIWDEQCAQLMGTSVAAYDGSVAGYEALIHPDDIADVAERVEAAIASRGELLLTYRSVSPGGDVRHLLSRGAVLSDEDGPASLIGAVVDVTPVHDAELARLEVARRLAGLVSVAHQLGEARSVEDVLAAVAEHGVSVLDSDGVVIALRRGDVLDVFATESFDAELRHQVAHLPLDVPLPLAYTTRTGDAMYLETFEEAMVHFPESAELYQAANTVASCSVPLLAGSNILGSLSAGWPQARTFTSGDRELFDALAVQTSQALVRIEAQAGAREALAGQLSLSASLQRGLLSLPHLPDQMRLSARYHAAKSEAQVGGDWYDAFPLSSGAFALAIGDVTGHDQNAAAVMGQLRNLLRGISRAKPELPAATLASLEDAMEALSVEALATALFAHVAFHPAGAYVRWCSAGHLPLLCYIPGEGARLLGDESAELMLGIGDSTPRSEHEVELPWGSVLALYTDGLVERRGEHLDEGLERAREVFESLCEAELSPEELSAGLIRELGTEQQEDDAAVLVVRICPSEEPVGEEVPLRDERELEGDEHVPRVLRAALRDLCEAAHSLPDLRDDALVVLSELTTNATVHGRTRLKVVMSATSTWVRIEVHDDNPHPPVVRRIQEGATSGRGMWLVSQLSHEWGTHSFDGGKVVWADLRAGDSSPPGPGDRA